jgi:hypothetical protein
MKEEQLSQQPLHLHLLLASCLLFFNLLKLNLTGLNCYLIREKPVLVSFASALK